MNKCLTLLLCLLPAIFYNATAQYKPYIKNGHHDNITHLFFSDDGNYLLSTDMSANTLLWDFFTRTEINSYRLGNANPIKISGDTVVELSNRAKWHLVSGAKLLDGQDEKKPGPAAPKKNTTRKTQAVKTGNKTVYIDKFNANETQLHFSADSSHFAYSEGDRYIIVRATRDPLEYRTIKMPLKVTALLFHPKLKEIIAVGQTDGSISVIDITSRTTVFVLKPEMLEIRHVAPRNGQYYLQGTNAAVGLTPADLKSYKYNIPTKTAPGNYVHTFDPNNALSKSICYFEDNKVKFGSDDETKILSRQGLRKKISRIGTVIFVHQLYGLLGPFASLMPTGFGDMPKTNAGIKATGTSDAVYYSTLFKIVKYKNGKKTKFKTPQKYREGKTGLFDMNDHYLVTYTSGDIKITDLRTRKSKYYYDYNSDMYKTTMSSVRLSYLKNIAVFEKKDSFILQQATEFTIFSIAPQPARQKTIAGYYLNEDPASDGFFYGDKTWLVFQHNDDTTLKKIPLHRQARLANAYVYNNGKQKGYLLFYEKGIADYVNETGDIVASYYFFENGDYIIFTPDNYFYTSSKTLLSKVTVTDAQQHTLTLDQFEARFNRPDIVLARLGYVDKDIVKQYERAYTLFANRNTNGNALEAKPPKAQIADWNNMLHTTDSFVTCHVVFSSQLPLKAVNIYNNNVPLWGEDGLQVAGKNITKLDTTISIPLINGDNILKPVCMQQDLQKNTVTSYYIHSEYKVSPRVYYLGIGVSNYQQQGYSLKYAAKDIRDLAGSLKQIYGNTCAIDTLLDERATTGNILAALKKLSVAGKNDIVIVSFSGHGILDADYQLVLGTNDVNFNNPAEHGLRYKDLESGLAAIPAYKKVLMMDACNSGEVDVASISRPKPAQAVDSAASVTDDRIAMRGLSIGDKQGQMLGTSFDVMQDAFGGFSQGNGAIVISAARGNQSALESKEWNNGAFTYALLQGLVYNKADLNKDKRITITELKSYVTNKVVEITKGNQKPTYRKDNLDFDWLVK